MYIQDVERLKAVLLGTIAQGMRRFKIMEGASLKEAFERIVLGYEALWAHMIDSYFDVDSDFPNVRHLFHDMTLLSAHSGTSHLPIRDPPLGQQ